MLRDLEAKVRLIIWTGWRRAVLCEVQDSDCNIRQQHTPKAPPSSPWVTELYSEMTCLSFEVNHEAS